MKKNIEPNGITLIGGINYSGKGYVSSLFTDVWRKRHPEISTSAISASTALMIFGDLLSHLQLQEMDSQARQNLRMQVFDYLASLSKNEQVILDTHFIFEDGEIVNHAPLLHAINRILLVQANPSTIISRALRDPKRLSHPGRQFVFKSGGSFIKDYASEEQRLAIETVLKVSRVGQFDSPPLTIIENNGLSLLKQIEKLP